MLKSAMARNWKRGEPFPIPAPTTNHLERTMPRTIRGVLAVLTALLVATPAAAQLPDIVITAGPTFPTGGFGDTREMGYNVGIGVRIAPPLMPLAFRADAQFNEFDRSTPPGGDATRVWSVTGNAVFNIPMGLPLSGPYLIGGLGAYGVRGDATRFGFNVGGGFRVGLAGFGVFGEARYHSAGNATFVPVSVGVIF
jgi:hypothetical protein